MHPVSQKESMPVLLISDHNKVDCLPLLMTSAVIMATARIILMSIGALRAAKISITPLDGMTDFNLTRAFLAGAYFC
jgi:hypothetical protein